MKILLVNPPRVNGIPVIREERCEITERYSVLPPYSLLQMGALLISLGHDIQLIDANGFDLDFNEIKNKIIVFSPDIVIFRFTPTTFDSDLTVAELAKMVDSKITTIGLCWTLVSIAKNILQEAKFMDIYVLGEYEIVIPQLIDSLNLKKTIADVCGIAFREGNKINVNTCSEVEFDYNELPLPAYSLINSLKPYYINTHTNDTFTIMYTSRGCPYNCIYCTVAGTKWKSRSADKIYEEISYLKKEFNIKIISFFDETFTINRERVVKICNEIIANKLDILWYCNTRVNLVDNELLKLMYKAGCRGISFGIESGSQKILDLCQKNVSTGQAAKAIKMAKKANIKVYCSFIFGLPGESWDTVNETLNFIKKTLPTGCQFNVAVPYPGTKLSEMIYGNLNLHADIINWRELYQHTAVIGTEFLKPKDLERARLKAYKSLYVNPRWWLQNILHVIKNPDDFQLALKYTIKIFKNYYFFKMKHAH